MFRDGLWPYGTDSRETKITCDSFGPVWKVVIGINNKAGREWKHSMHFHGSPKKVSEAESYYSCWLPCNP